MDTDLERFRIATTRSGENDCSAAGQLFRLAVANFIGIERWSRDRVDGAARL